MRVLIFAILALLPLPLIAATGDFVPLSPIPNLGTSGDITLEQYANAVFMLAISVGAILAVLRIITGGFKYMTTEAVTTKGDARLTIQNAVVGLLLLLSVWLVLSIINPQIADLSALKFTELKPSDKTLKAVADDRAKRKEIAQRLEKDIQEFATAEGYFTTNRLGNEFRVFDKDVTGLLGFEENKYKRACRSEGKKFIIRETISCKNTSTKKIREKGISSRVASELGGVPRKVEAFYEFADEFTGGKSCGSNEVYVDGSYHRVIRCVQEL